MNDSPIFNPQGTLIGRIDLSKRCATFGIEERDEDWNDESRQFDSPVRLLSAGDLNHLSGLTFKRLHQPTDIRPDLDLVPRQADNVIRSLADRR